MGFYELGNGCDSCDTVSSILPNNVNMQMDSNSGIVANMAMPYGTQNNMMKQFNGAISSGYAQGSNMGYGGNGSSGSTMGSQPTQMQQMVMVPATTVSIPTTTGQPMKQVATAGSVAVMIPSPNSAPATSTTKIEGFSDGTMSDQGKMFAVLGLVIFSALAANECCKYFLNKSLQLNDGSPLYYVAYVAVAVLLAFAAYTYANKN
jgi:hypothetical protein